MAGGTTKEILETLLDKLQNIAATKTVVGEPVMIGEKIIVPVVKVALGVGAGSGAGPGKADGDGPGGSGGGAGLSVSPVAFIVIDGHNIHLFGTKPSVLDNLTAKLPDLVNSISDAIPKFQNAKKAAKEAKEEKTDEKTEE